MRSSPDEGQRHDYHDDLDDLYYVEQAIPATRAVGPETEHAIGAGADEVSSGFLFVARLPRLRHETVLIPGRVMIP